MADAAAERALVARGEVAMGRREQFCAARWRLVAAVATWCFR
jgi:hypothetical protein